jgi:pimeloyl-ACP methyl ester carboxylesterase
LGEIVVPTLILHGRRDHIAPLALAREMHAAIAGSAFVKFPAGISHWSLESAAASPRK